AQAAPTRPRRPPASRGARETRPAPAPAPTVLPRHRPSAALDARAPTSPSAGSPPRTEARSDASRPPANHFCQRVTTKLPRVFSAPFRRRRRSTGRRLSSADPLNRSRRWAAVRCMGSHLQFGRVRRSICPATWSSISSRPRRSGVLGRRRIFTVLIYGKERKFHSL
uniref:Uncharacterized protein n=1 Tax=Mustela putorius furo TaxID=9669 RepID=M3Y5P2_MUSPF